MSVGKRRLGILGTENSHAELIVRHLNVEGRLPWEVVALLGPDPARNDELIQLGAQTDVAAVSVNAAEEMVDLVDAVIVTDRDGGLHRAHAIPFLDRGIPVLVDKPMTTSVEDAQAILGSAAQGNALVTSFSALRWAPVVEELAATVAAGVVDPVAAFAVGPAELQSEYGGIFYYGVHPVEALCHVLPGEFGPVSVDVRADRWIVQCSIGTVAVTMALLQPAEGEWAPFHLSVAGRNEVAGGDIVLPSDYLFPGLERFFAMVDSGEQPLTDVELLRPIELLSAIRAAAKRADHA